MGVYFDYFRAGDDQEALRTHELPGGPLAGDPARFDGVATKGVFPDPHLELLVAHASRAPYERGATTSWGLWPPPDTPPPTDETSPWLTDPAVERLATRIRDVLAGIAPQDVSALAETWAGDISHSVAEAAERIADLAALAGRARDAAQELYCWSSL